MSNAVDDGQINCMIPRIGGDEQDFGKKSSNPRVIVQRNWILTLVHSRFLDTEAQQKQSSPKYKVRPKAEL